MKSKENTCEMKTNNRSKWIVAVGMLVVIVVQVAMMGYFGTLKKGYHIDEMFTYELANYPNVFFSRTEGFLDSWVEGDFYRQALSVDGIGDLDFSIPYHNQEEDVHPPLYYFVIHLMSACFPGEMSKWSGIIPNMAFCMVTAVLLYLIAKRTTQNRILAFAITIAWAWSVGVMTSAVFIRMYAMLTCLCMALVYVHLVAMDCVQAGRLKKRILAALFLLTTAGILTQYYYLVFCFFLCGGAFFYLCLTKRWKMLIQYTLVELCSLLAAVLIFPKMLYHIFGGYRGQEAFSNMAQGGGYFTGLKTVGTFISRQLCNGWVKNVLILMVAAFVVYFVWVHLLHLHLSKKSGGAGYVVKMNVALDRHFSLSFGKMDLVVVFLGLVAIGYCLIVAKVAPYKTDRYFFCIYPLVSLCLGYFVYHSVLFFTKRPQVTGAVVSVLTVLMIILSYQMQNVNYLFPYLEQNEKDVAAYTEYPVITLSVFGSSQHTADIFATEFPRFPQVYRCSKGDFSGIQKAAQTADISDGFLLYILDYGSMTDEELQEKVAQQVALDDFELVSRAGCNVYFCTLEEAAS